MSKSCLYFDAAATVPMLPEVIETIYNEMKTTWGNPSSLHMKGQIAHEKMEQARVNVAEYLECEPDEIIFTGSASAANNLALKGFTELNPSLIITDYAEHKSIINTVQYLQHYRKVPYLMVSLDETGSVNLSELENFIRFADSCEYPVPVLVSIGMANSEIGTIQDIPKIAEIVHKYNGVLHVDATQCLTKLPIDIRCIDMMTAGGSKIGAGKGIGILYKKKHIQLTPLIHGGGQEQGLIAGTEDVPKMIGFATTLKRTHYDSMDTHRDFFIRLLTTFNTPYIINGHPTRHLDNILNISFKNKNAERIVESCSMLGLYISAGSACNSGSTEPSMAVKAIGVPDDYINGTIRISIPQNVDFVDINDAVHILKYVVDELC